MYSANSTNAPLVAVVTPVYNGGKYLREAMESVQAQDYPNLVHVVLNNHSTDDTAEIIADYADAKIPVIAAQNDELLPLYDNWNTAVSLTPKDAKYFRLLCADDRMAPDCTSKMVEVAEQDDEVLLVGCQVSLNDDLMDFQWPEGQSTMDGDAAIRGFFQNTFGFFAVHMLLRANVLDWRNPIYDDVYVGADFESVLAILRRGKFGMVHEQLGWVRIHSESQTSTVAMKSNTHFRDWLNTLYVYGPDVMSSAEFKALAKRYQRYYLRQSLRWRRQFGESAAKPHFEALESVRGPVKLVDLVDAFADGVLTRLGLRTQWTGWPN